MGTMPRPMRLARFPTDEIQAIPERDPQEVMEDFLLLLRDREKDRVTIPRRLALEIARVLPLVRRKGRLGRPPTTQRKLSRDKIAVWDAERRKNELVQQHGMSKTQAQLQAAEEIAQQLAADAHGPVRPLSDSSINDAMGRKSRLPTRRKRKKTSSQ